MGSAAFRHPALRIPALPNPLDSPAFVQSVGANRMRPEMWIVQKMLL
jgi:hypothetical protein